MSKAGRLAQVKKKHKYHLPLFLNFRVALGVTDPGSLKFFWYFVSQANFGDDGYCSQTSKNKQKEKREMKKKKKG